ncbi:glycosyltransferase family 2 protein [Pseudomonas sp. RIT-PI-S]|uniref:glycosyltransferase family 2 protein n=1 Tax=Pseudomonas sp. RIT-PI-S TaxID=3035295 RepID=UPI0021DA5C46|nr:glycosyltransferase family 2 protein [Pseudomonas sp. RIT-PI-S]
MSPRNILISVVIPTYNYAHYLTRVLDSITSQVMENIEVIVVDDGSTDGTLELLRQYASRWPVVDVVTQSNAGAGAARNAGIRRARGEYILPLDADDELTPTALAAFKEAVSSRPELDVVLGGHISVGPDGKEKSRMPAAVLAMPEYAMARQYLLEKRIAISHSCTLFRRACLLARPYPENLKAGEDIPVFAYVLVSGQVGTIAQPIARIHRHSDSLRNTRDEERTALAIVEEVFATLPAPCQPLRCRYKAQRYLSLFRNSILAKDWAGARRYYWLAFRLSPAQALRWDYFKKLSRIVFRR